LFRVNKHSSVVSWLLVIVAAALKHFEMKLFALIFLATLVVGDRFYQQQPYSPVVLKSPWQLASSPINRDLFLYPSQINNWVQYVFSEYFSTPVPVPDPVIPTMPDDDYIRKNPGYFSVVRKF
jgi:hypothetical protein